MMMKAEVRAPLDSHFLQLLIIFYVKTRIIRFKIIDSRVAPQI